MGFQLTPMVRMLLLLNVGIFIMQELTPGLTNLAALYTPGFSPFFQPWQFVSYLFLHGGLWHLAGNMFALFIFGPRLEQFWGPQRFLFFYLFTGIGAGVLHTGVTYYELNQLQADTYAYVQNPSSDAFTRYMNDHAKAYYNQLYEFTSKYDENPENPSYIQQSQSIVSDYYQSRQNVPTVGASGPCSGY
jgi:membrane associated rhomboid family serine protease